MLKTFFQYRVTDAERRLVFMAPPGPEAKPDVAELKLTNEKAKEELNATDKAKFNAEIRMDKASTEFTGAKNKLQSVMQKEYEHLINPPPGSARATPERAAQLITEILDKAGMKMLQAKLTTDTPPKLELVVVGAAPVKELPPKLEAVPGAKAFLDLMPDAVRNAFIDAVVESGSDKPLKEFGAFIAKFNDAGTTPEQKGAIIGLITTGNVPPALKNDPKIKEFALMLDPKTELGKLLGKMKSNLLGVEASPGLETEGKMVELARARYNKAKEGRDKPGATAEEKARYELEMDFIKESTIGTLMMKGLQVPESIMTDANVTLTKLEVPPGKEGQAMLMFHKLAGFVRLVSAVIGKLDGSGLKKAKERLTSAPAAGVEAEKKVLTLKTEITKPKADKEERTVTVNMENMGDKPVEVQQDIFNKMKAAGKGTDWAKVKVNADAAKPSVIIVEGLTEAEANIIKKALDDYSKTLKPGEAKGPETKKEATVEEKNKLKEATDNAYNKVDAATKVAEPVSLDGLKKLKNTPDLLKDIAAALGAIAKEREVPNLIVPRPGNLDQYEGSLQNAKTMFESVLPYYIENLENMDGLIKARASGNEADIKKFAELSLAGNKNELAGLKTLKTKDAAGADLSDSLLTKRFIGGASIPDRIKAIEKVLAEKTYENEIADPKLSLKPKLREAVIRRRIDEGFDYLKQGNGDLDGADVSSKMLMAKVAGSAKLPEMHTEIDVGSGRPFVKDTQFAFIEDNWVWRKNGEGEFRPLAELASDKDRMNLKRYQNIYNKLKSLNDLPLP
jgi:hypothetical protein